MIAGFKALVARFWPVLRLRTILFGTLLFVAALPGFAAVFLRVYENALVRRTEAELVAQSAALAASAAILWPDAQTANTPPTASFRDSATEVDLRTTPILPERPDPSPAGRPPDPRLGALARQLAPAFAETKQTTLSSILMLDGDGTILDGPAEGKSLGTLPEVKQALAGNAATALRVNADYRPTFAFEWLSRASNLRLHHARPIRVNGQVAGVILVSRSPRALFRGIYEDRGKIALGVVSIFLLLIVLSGVLSRAIVRPMENLSRATRALALGRRDAPQRPSLEVVEIRDLYADFEAMADAIDSRSRYLRDFAASVSHEFKTPLAGISGAIELLQDHGKTMSGPERERFLGNMAADAERLSRLVTRLMELAQADMQGAQTQESADIASILNVVADSLRTPAFDIAVAMATPLPRVSVEARTLEAILTVLIDNARQAGAQQVRIIALAGVQALTIDVSDNGPGIDPADQDRIFDPFFTSKRADGGTGLGLPIARSLAESYRMTLDLVGSDGGAHFRLTLPGALLAPH